MEEEGSSTVDNCVDDVINDNVAERTSVGDGECCGDFNSNDSCVNSVVF